MQWIGPNTGLIGVVGDGANLLIAVVWLAYLQLFFMAYRRQRRPMILINRARGAGKDSHCLISNMSEKPIYALCIVALIEDNGDSWVCAVTDDDDMANGEATSPKTHQGPLNPGEFMDVGSFNTMLHRAQAQKKTVQENTEDQRSIRALEVKVIAMYSSSDNFIGASRRFEPSPDGSSLRPTELETRQLSGAGDRRHLKSLLHDHL